MPTQARHVLFAVLAAAVSAAAASAESAPAGGAAGPRRVEVRGEWLYVDGEPFLVKGIGYSPYRPGQVPWRDRVAPAVWERDFQRIAAAGFNTLRTWAPLPDEALRLAKAHGLLVLQGIWIERNGDYHTAAFRETMLQILRREAERAKAHDNVLALIVGNELLPEQVLRTGIRETEELLARAAEAIRTVDRSRLVSYANWPSLALLSAAPWDLICYNLYPYEPASVSHAFGFRGYVEHLKRGSASRKPLLLTEVGLSLSRTAGKPGYGGYSPSAHRQELLRLWDAAFQGGAQGAAIFEWNDEWWKQAESSEDAAAHDPDDPEEWFGLVEFQGPDDVEGRLRPAYAALQTYNHAILLSPVTGQSYEERLPVTVYATDQVAAVQFRLGQGWFKGWTQATRLSRHWWKATVPLNGRWKPGEYPLVVEALDAKGRRLVQHSRPVTVRRPVPGVRVHLTTDRGLYEVGPAGDTARFSVEVTGDDGRPLPQRPVAVSIVEPDADVTITQTKTTDAQGRLEGSYLINEPGLVTISAATAPDPAVPARRVGDEAFLIVRRHQVAGHVASPWEAGLPAPVREALRHERPAFALADAGSERVVDYARYGRFVEPGTAAYRYEVSNWEGLAAAAGEGIYPNEAGLIRDPAFRAAREGGKLKGSHWDFTFHKDVPLSFFRWASADEEPGVKQFYTALTLERAGLWAHAVKAYHAVLVHFPSSIGWTAFDPPTPWYVAKVARDKIEAILRLHPELGLRLEGASVVIDGGFDNDLDNDAIKIHPGMLVKVPPDAVNPPALDLTAAGGRTVGQGRVQLRRLANGHWQLLVEGKPWQVRGVTFQPSQVGESPDEGTLQDWMQADRNGNGRIDAWDTFVDANRNGARDADEPVVGDFALLKAMGVNTLRLYHHASNKALLRQLYERYGIMCLIGDFVGMYTVGSGATWEQGTDYLNKEQRQRMTESVKALVREHKDEPYVLMWVLGNENNYGGVHGIIGGVGNAGQHPKAYYEFLNELASWIHAEDPNHPVAVANGDLGFLDLIAKYAPAIDVFGTNVYRGWHGFGRTLFEEVRRHLDKPVLITEYGCPAYQTGEPREVAERDQALYHFGNWVDLADNAAGRGVGNALGGVVFEWSDEWWKGGQPPRFSPQVQETQPNWAGPFPGGWNFEEWYGLVGQGDGRQSPYLRQLRTGYELYQALWNN